VQGLKSHKRKSAKIILGLNPYDSVQVPLHDEH